MADDAAPPAKAAARAGDCVICLMPLLNGEDTLSTTRCGHCFHYLCITQSVEYRPACPMCTASLSSDDLHTVAPTYFKADPVTAEADAAADTEHSAEVSGLQHRLQVEVQQRQEMLRRLKEAEARAAELEDRAATHGIERRVMEEAQRRSAVEAARTWEELHHCKQDLAQARGKVAQLEQRLSAHRVAELIDETAGTAAIQRDVLRAAPAVKDEFIVKQHRSLHAAKRREEELGEEVAELRKRAGDAERARDKYKTRYKELRSTASQRAPRSPRAAGAAAAAKGGAADGEIAELQRRVENRALKQYLAGGGAASLAPPSAVASLIATSAALGRTAAAAAAPGAAPSATSAFSFAPEAGGLTYTPDVLSAPAPAPQPSQPPLSATGGRRRGFAVDPAARKNALALMREAEYRPNAKQTKLR